MATVLALVFAVAACAEDPELRLAGIVREPPPDVSTVTLPDASNGGTPFSTAAEPGRLLLVYFGYTSCPDICPTTLADLRSAVQGLGGDGEMLDVAMVTVDPGRDTPEVLTGYIQTFFPNGRALRAGDPALLAEAAEAYGASYSVTPRDDGTVDVEHSAFLYAVDSSGHIALQWPFGTPRADLRNDLRILLDRLEEGEA